jgi:hypothetical protein
MTKRRVLLLAALPLAVFFVARSSRIQGADERKKASDALQTARAFLSFAFMGDYKAAAELGESGKSYSREQKIKEFERLEPKKPPAIGRFEADDAYALAITEAVVDKDKKQAGPLSIRLVKKDGHWLIRDVDMGSKSADKNLERFRREHPKAMVVLPKKGK